MSIGCMKLNCNLAWHAIWVNSRRCILRKITLIFCNFLSTRWSYDDYLKLNVLIIYNIILCDEHDIAYD